MPFWDRCGQHCLYEEKRMPIPKYNELYIPFLTAIEDGNVHTMKEVREKVAEMLSLGEEELSERLPSGNQTFDNRIGWAKTPMETF